MNCSSLLSSAIFANWSTRLALRLPCLSLLNSLSTVFTRVLVFSSVARLSMYLRTIAMPVSAISDQPSTVLTPKVRRKVLSLLVNVWLNCPSSLNPTTSSFICNTVWKLPKTASFTVRMSWLNLRSSGTAWASSSSTICW